MPWRSFLNGFIDRRKRCSLAMVGGYFFAVIFFAAIFCRYVDHSKDNNGLQIHLCFFSLRCFPISLVVSLILKVLKSTLRNRYLQLNGTAKTTRRKALAT